MECTYCMNVSVTHMMIPAKVFGQFGGLPSE